MTDKTKNIHVKSRPDFSGSSARRIKKGDRIVSDTMACEKTDSHIFYGS